MFSPLVFIKNILFLHGIYWHDFQLINEPSWSISLEFWASLLISLIFVHLKLIMKVVIVIISFVLLVFYNRSGVPGTLVTAFVSMLIGSICFDLTKKYGF